MLVLNSDEYHGSIVAKFTDEQYTTINQSAARCFDLRVFVTCTTTVTRELLQTNCYCYKLLPTNCYRLVSS